MAVWFWRTVFDDGGRRGSQEGGFVDERFGALGYGCEVGLLEGWREGV